MSQITWRNVDAPDFSGALTGIEVANKLFNQALESADSGIDKYRGMQTDAANRAIIGRMASITDPVAYEEAQRQGLIVGPDSQNASIAMLQKAADQGGVLTERAANAEDLRSGLYKNKRSEGFDAADDAFSPNYAVITEQARKGNLDFLKEIPKLPGWDALSPERKAGVMSNFESSIASGQTFKLNLSREARAAADAARARVLAGREDLTYQEVLADKNTQKLIDKFIVTHQELQTKPEEVLASFYNEARTLNPRQTMQFANAIKTQLGLDTKYSFNPLETPDFSATAEQDIAALDTQTAANLAYQGRDSRLTDKITKTGAVGGLSLSTHRINNQNEDDGAIALDKAVTTGPLKGADKVALKELYNHYLSKGFIGKGENQVSPTNFFAVMANSLTEKTYTGNEADIGLGELAVDEDFMGKKGTLTTQLEQANRKNISVLETGYNTLVSKKTNLNQAKKAADEAQTYYLQLKKAARGDDSPGMARKLEEAKKAQIRAFERLDLISKQADK